MAAKTKAIFYTTATCNLNCRYCVIDKNPILKKIDDALDESFKGDYYFNFTKEIFKDKNQLRSIEIWGGEPYLAMHRIYYTLEKMLEYYPNIASIFGSTNLLAPNFIEELTGLLTILGKFNNRISFELQISLDGPKIITDANRGNGVTESLTTVFTELVKVLPNIVPKNVTFTAHFKPTLDGLSLYLLNTKDKLIEYFEFFEEFYDIFNNNIKEKNIKIRTTLPNLATPSNFTQEDGLFFRDFYKNLLEIEKEYTFKYFKSVVILSGLHGSNSYCFDTSTQLTDNLGLCGINRNSVGFLPNRMVSVCHAAFVELVADYKKAMLNNVNRKNSVDDNMFTNYYANAFCFPVEELEEFDKKYDSFHDVKSKAKTVTVANEIMMLAYAGQVQEKYKDKDEAIKGAKFIWDHASNCAKDNLGSASSFYAMPIGSIKIFLNGAEDIILEWEKEKQKTNDISRRTK